MRTFENLDKLTILHYPNPILKKASAPVEEFGEELVQLSQRMLELMKQEPGIGLAAPQVGILIRLFVCNVTGEPDDDLVFVNPRFTELTGAVDCEEGCLSVPGVNVTKRRASHAVIEAMDATGRPFQMSGIDLLARVWQHETDHLDGRLISDTMSTADEIVNRRAIKQLKEEYAGGRPAPRG
ncbi:MAG: peptide deformylase [Phycisphaerales bacterium]|nr:MAG: peptide deformylase [Phycisphaerales bacterium]